MISRSLGTWTPCDEGAVDFSCPMVCLANREIYPRPPCPHWLGWELRSGRQRTGLSGVCSPLQLAQDSDPGRLTTQVSKVPAREPASFLSPTSWLLSPGTLLQM